MDYDGCFGGMWNDEMEKAKPAAKAKPEYKVPDRQEKILTIQDVDLLAVLTGRGKLDIPADLPLDVRLKRLFENNDNSQLCMVITHESFPSIPYGHYIPKVPLTVTYLEQVQPQAEEPKIVSAAVEETLDNREV